MVSVYVGPNETRIVTADGRSMWVKESYISAPNGRVNLQAWVPPKDLTAVEFVISGRYLTRTIRPPMGVTAAILHFLGNYQTERCLSFDCYAFANLVKGVTPHKVLHLMQYWHMSLLPWRMPADSVIFLLSGQNVFHHAAVYLGSGLYLSVWGAGGHLEVASLEAMKRDFGAERVVLATKR